MAQNWQEKAAGKRRARDDSIPKEWRLSPLPTFSKGSDLTSVPRSCGILSRREVEITEHYDATGLASAISQKKYSSLEVAVAFCKRAAIAQQLVNCLTETLFDVAINRAKALDHYHETHGKTMGPLHGVPVSLKDSFKITGYDSTIGFVSLVDKPSVSMSPLVSLLLTAGAVIYCKTNVPQTLMALDSMNNVFGRTLNPLNTAVTAGGSSGGEGALMGMGGSVLGIGTDIGGSIRIPAFCNNVYGFMPSAHRVPYANQQESGPPSRAQVALESRAGPLTRSVRDIDTFMRALTNLRPWDVDPLVIPGHWDTMTPAGGSAAAASGKSSLTFGIISTDLVTQPLPPIRDLLRETAEMLRSAGHTVVQLPTPPAYHRVQSWANSLMGLDGGQAVFDHLKATGEPLIPWLSGRMRQKRSRTSAEAQDMHAQRTSVRTEMLQKLWIAPNGSEIDALICPVAPHPVPAIDHWGGVGYTSGFVYLDYCAGTVPVRKFKESDMSLEFEAGEQEVLSLWDKNNRRLWDKAGRSTYLGTGMSVQVVAPRLQEKKLQQAMAAVDAAVKDKFWSMGDVGSFSAVDVERLPFVDAKSRAPAKL